MITRHNYEEYFLLYVDNELNEVQRAAVDNFVQENPDVAGELEVLKRTTLTADNVIRFETKNTLYKKETCISLASYQEYFLLAVDKELDNKEAAELENFILQHPQLQDEYILLKQTVLPAESFEFSDKSILYREEKKERRIPVAFIRMSVAASMIGVIATLLLLRQNSVETLNANNLVVKQPKINASPKFNKEIKFADAVTQQTHQPLHRQGKNDEPVVKINRQRGQQTNTNINIESSDIKKANDVNLVKQDERAVVAPSEIFNEELKLTASSSGQNPVNSSLINSIDKEVAKVTFTENKNLAEDKTFISKSLYHEVENEENGNSIYIGAAEFNKAKLKGLLRKAVNFFDKKNNNNDSEKMLQIASFQIKSK